MGLDGSVCIVTGGGSGIGRAAALLMASEGAKLAVAGRTESKVEGVAEEIGSAGGTCRAYTLDVADRDAVFWMAEDVRRSLGPVAVLVNSAGHSSPNRALLTTTPEDIQNVLDSNLIGTIYSTQAVVPDMLEAGQGTIINVSSLAAMNPSLLAGMAYSASKAAVNNFTGFLNEEFKHTRIRATAIIPGEVDTPIMELRPVPPPRRSRDGMVGDDDVAQAIALVARLPAKSTIPEMVIRPTVWRDVSKEIVEGG